MSPYPDLNRKYGWKFGVHRAPAGYEHPWLVILAGETIGAWSRDEARGIWRERKEKIK